MAARAKMKVRIRALHRMSAKLALVENFDSAEFTPCDGSEMARGDFFLSVRWVRPTPQTHQWIRQPQREALKSCEGGHRRLRRSIRPATRPRGQATDHSMSCRHPKLGPPRQAPQSQMGDTSLRMRRGYGSRRPQPDDIGKSRKKAAAVLGGLSFDHGRWIISLQARSKVQIEARHVREKMSER